MLVEETTMSSTSSPQTPPSTSQPTSKLLRKLTKYETKYPELLKAYRAEQARIERLEELLQEWGVCDSVDEIDKIEDVLRSGTAASGADTTTNSESTYADNSDIENEAEETVVLRIEKESLEEQIELINKENADLKLRLSSEIAAEKSDRMEISSLVSIVAEKEEKIQQLLQENAELQQTVKSTETRLGILRTGLQAQESQRQRDSRLKQSLDAAQAGRDAALRDRDALRAQLANLQNAAADHAEQLRTSDDRMADNHSRMAELADRLADSTKQNKALEMELERCRATLQDRSRELAALQKCINSSEDSQDLQFKELVARLQQAQAAQAALEQEASQAAKKRAREAATQRRQLRELQDALDLAEREKARYATDARELRSSRSLADDRVLLAEQEADEARQEALQLKQTLAGTETALKSAGKTIADLKGMLQAAQARVDRLSTDARANQINRLRSQKSTMALNSTLSSTPADNARAPSPSAAAATAGVPNVAYIKNVLLGYLEHKTQRRLLLPVVSTVLEFKDNDEARFLAAIK
ncbi:hypothetical protein DV454_004456 [Geotrichum candidum]|nr:hypothetical protein DV454_004456 [Geotrichum candidum]